MGGGESPTEAVLGVWALMGRFAFEIVFIGLLFPISRPRISILWALATLEGAASPESARPQDVRASEKKRHD